MLSKWFILCYSLFYVVNLVYAYRPLFRYTTNLFIPKNLCSTSIFLSCLSLFSKLRYYA